MYNFGLEWLVLVAIILITRALHCYLHYRAERVGVTMPTHQDGDDAQNPQQIIHEISRSGRFFFLSSSSFTFFLSFFLSFCVPP